jgi:hypothetical protein
MPQVPPLPAGFELEAAPSLPETGGAPPLPPGFVIEMGPGAPSVGQIVAQDLKQGAVNTLAGAVRGAGSIGATLLTPIDWAARKVGIQNGWIGRTDRRQMMDEGLRSMGANPDSLAYQGAKIGAEIAGTAGAGGAVARTLGAVPWVATNAAPLLNAIASSGTTAQGLKGLEAAAARLIGGGVSGGLSMGLIDPDYARRGAVIGAVAPFAVQGLGKAGHWASGKLRGGPATPEMAQALREAHEAGYVVPPSQAGGGVLSRTAEGYAGKLTTAQNASARNAVTTNQLVAADLGLPPDVAVTPGVLEKLRHAAGKAYEAVRATGTLTPGPAYAQQLDDIAAPYVATARAFPGAKPSPVIDLIEGLKVQQMPATSAVDKIRQLRRAAQDAFKPGGNTDLARANQRAADVMEGALEEHLKALGLPDLLGAFRQSRVLIAKTHTAEKVLNESTGTFNAAKLGSELDRGVPLTGGMLEAAQFARRFPKLVQTPEKMGSLTPNSPLDWFGAIGTTLATESPLGLVTLMGRPVTRAGLLTEPVQSMLANTPTRIAGTGLSEAAASRLSGAAPVAILGLRRATPAGLEASP